MVATKGTLLGLLMLCNVREHVITAVEKRLDQAPTLGTNPSTAEFTELDDRSSEATTNSLTAI